MTGEASRGPSTMPELQDYCDLHSAPAPFVRIGNKRRSRSGVPRPG